MKSIIVSRYTLLRFILYISFVVVCLNFIQLRNFRTKPRYKNVYLQSADFENISQSNLIFLRKREVEDKNISRTLKVTPDLKKTGSNKVKVASNLKKTGSNKVKVVSSKWCDYLKDEYPLVTDFNQILAAKGEMIDGISPIHLHPYRYVYNSSNACANETSVNIVIVVKSSVRNFELRQAIRNTLVKEVKADGNKIVFSLGISKDPKMQFKVEEEYLKYEDVIQENFVDNYFNNSLKTIMGIKWIATFCTNAKYALMVDDDVIVHYRNLVSYFKGVSLEKQKYLFSGNLKPRPGPMRSKHARWFMSHDEFPWDCYPPYLSGGALLMSGEFVHALNASMPYIKRFKYDDVYLSIVAQKIGVTPQRNSKVTMRTINGEKLRNFIASHGFSKVRSYLQGYRFIKFSNETEWNI